MPAAAVLQLLLDTIADACNACLLCQQALLTLCPADLMTETSPSCLISGLANLQESLNADAARHVTSMTSQQHGPEQAETSNSRINEKVQENAPALQRWVTD